MKKNKFLRVRFRIIIKGALQVRTLSEPHPLASGTPRVTRSGSRPGSGGPVLSVDDSDSEILALPRAPSGDHAAHLEALTLAGALAGAESRQRRSRELPASVVQLEDRKALERRE